MDSWEYADQIVLYWKSDSGLRMIILLYLWMHLLWQMVHVLLKSALTLHGAYFICQGLVEHCSVNEDERAAATAKIFHSHRTWYDRFRDFGRLIILTPPMFKKPLSNLKTSGKITRYQGEQGWWSYWFALAPLRSSDRRKLKQRALQSFAQIPPEDGDVLVPDGLLSVKFSTHLDEPGVRFNSVPVYALQFSNIIYFWFV